MLVLVKLPARNNSKKVASCRTILIDCVDFFPLPSVFTLI